MTGFELTSESSTFTTRPRASSTMIVILFLQWDSKKLGSFLVILLAWIICGLYFQIHIYWLRQISHCKSRMCFDSSSFLSLSLFLTLTPTHTNAHTHTHILCPCHYFYLEVSYHFCYLFHKLYASCMYKKKTLTPPRLCFIVIWRKTEPTI